LTNSGNAALAISSIGITGANAGDFSQTNTCPTGSNTLAASATCAISVTFAPTATGSRTASVTVTDNAADSPESVPLSGTGAASAGTYLTDGFESGNLNVWNKNLSSGGAASVESTVVNSGSDAAQLTNKASTDFTGLNAGLAGGGQTLTYSRFCFNLSGLSGSTPLAQGRDVNGNNLWEVDYDAGLKGLDIYFWNGISRTRTDLFSPANVLVANTWYCAEVEANEMSTGHGEVWLNGTSIGKVDTDLSATNAYSQLYLWNNGAAGTVYMDDVQVANTSSGPVGAGAAGPAVSLSPTSMTFGSQQVSSTSPAQAVTLTNSGTAPLAISSIATAGSNAADFAQTNNCPNTLAGGSKCTVNVTFAPSSAGSRTASVTVTDNAADSPESVGLSGTGTVSAPAVSLNPATLSFGNQPTETTSSAQSVTLTNTGTTALSITSIGVIGTNAGDFTQNNNCPTSPNTLVAGASCTISVTFTPTATGSRAASISITDNAADSPESVALSGTGTTPVPVVSLNPASLSFGNQLIGTTSAAQTVTLTNSGMAPLTISGIGISGTNAGDFAQTNTCPISPSTLAAGSKCTISVTFSPTATGGRTASVSITDNAADSPENVSLSGTGTAPGATVSPSSLSLGNQLIGTTSAAQTVTFTNNGTAALSITSIGITGTNTGDFGQTNTCPISPSTLAAGSNCTISVTFKPSATGTRTASVNVSDNASGSPQSVALSGTGTSPAVTLNPTSLTFASQTVKTNSAAQSVTLTDSGTAPLTISSIGITGTNSGDFAQTNTCPISPSTLAVNGSCTVSVTFKPTAMGTRTASLNISDNASGSPQGAGLSGTSVLFSDGFESGSLPGAWTSTKVTGNNTLSLDTTLHHGGSASLKAVKTKGTAGNAYVSKTITGQTSLDARGYYYLSNPVNFGAVQVMSLYGGNNNTFIGSVTYNVDPRAPTFTVYNGANNTTYTCSAVPSLNAWHSIELQYTLATTTTGSFTLWLDGTQVCGKTGIKTSPQSGLTITQVRAGVDSADKTAGLTVHVDDIIVNQNYIGP